MSVKGLIIALFVAIASISVASAAELRTTSDVDSARFAEYHSIFGAGVVMGYTAADHGMQVRGEMAEGEKCGMHADNCGCQTCHKDCGCSCPGAAYDCWGVWHADNYWHFDATRDSDVDMVLGDGGRGDHSFFGWGGW
jgi:hypothetical protein